MLKYKLYVYLYISRTNVHYRNCGIMKDIKNYALGVENNCQEKLRIRSRKKKFMRNYAFKVKKMMFSGRVMTLNKNTPTRLQQ